MTESDSGDDPLPSSGPIPFDVREGWPTPFTGTTLCFCEAGPGFGSLLLSDRSWTVLKGRRLFSARLDPALAGGAIGRWRRRRATSTSTPVAVPATVLGDQSFEAWAFEAHGGTGRLLIWDDGLSLWLVNDADLELTLICAPDDLFADERARWSDAPFGWASGSWSDTAWDAVVALTARYGAPTPARPLSERKIRDTSPWLGRWDQISWARHRMHEDRATPYATAQLILAAIEGERSLWRPAGRDVLQRELRRWDRVPGERQRIERDLRAHIDSLVETAVPPQRL